MANLRERNAATQRAQTLLWDLNGTSWERNVLNVAAFLIHLTIGSTRSVYYSLSRGPAPGARKSRAGGGADENIIVEIPHRCLAGSDVIE